MGSSSSMPQEHGEAPLHRAHCTRKSPTAPPHCMRTLHFGSTPPARTRARTTAHRFTGPQAIYQLPACQYSHSTRMNSWRARRDVVVRGTTYVVGYMVAWCSVQCNGVLPAVDSPPARASRARCCHARCHYRYSPPTTPSACSATYTILTLSPRVSNACVLLLTTVSAWHAGSRSGHA